jgi:aminopeptidase YwaD
VKRFVPLTAVLLLAASSQAFAQKPPLLPEKDVAALASELSGETAKRNLEGLARLHRQRGSQGFHSAAELVAERLRAYGVTDVAIFQFPADGKIFYGTQRSRPAWDAEFAELWQVTPEIIGEGGKSAYGQAGAADKMVWNERSRLASFEAEPVTLAEDSESADVTANLVDVGAGTNERDYASKDVKGKIVLVSAQPGAVQDLAVGKFGAVGIVSYAQNQKTAWSGDDQNLIRWGHLDTFSPNKTFAFMVSLKRARKMQDWLAQSNHSIALHAVVKAGQHPGNYEVVTATIPGSDRKLKDEEIAFSCHLDHQRPGANDNASGCSAILEVARTLQKLIDAKQLPRPSRTIRFIFPPEIEGTVTLLNAKPELAKRIKAVVHMDMVGGGPETKSVFHVTRGPMSLPSFVHDVAWSFAQWVNEESYKFAATGEAQFPMIAPEGGKEPLRAECSPYSMGSDHDVYQDSSFAIPAIYLNDWPDRYIHTNFDSAANIDPSKLKRAAFIGAASGYFLAQMSPTDYAAILESIKTNQFQRTGEAVRRTSQLSEDEAKKLLGEYLRNEERLVNSINSIVPISMIGNETRPPLPKDSSSLEALTKSSVLGAGAKPYWKRKSEPKGQLAVFGYDYFSDHAKAASISTPKLLAYEGWWGGGEEYAYEVLNFANGQRNAQEIRDAVSAEYGPVPVELVVEYLQALEKIAIVERVK